MPKLMSAPVFGVVVDTPATPLAWLVLLVLVLAAPPPLEL